MALGESQVTVGSYVGPVGRISRLILGVSLVGFALPFYIFPDRRVTFFGIGYHSNRGSTLTSLAVTAAFLVLFLILHYTVYRYLPRMNKWLGAILANVPLILAFVFGGGAIRISVLTYAGLSLLIASWRSDSGCEVMSMPNIIFRRRTHLPCVIFTPIDWAEQRRKVRVAERGM